MKWTPRLVVAVISAILALVAITLLAIASFTGAELHETIAASILGYILGSWTTVVGFYFTDKDHTGL